MSMVDETHLCPNKVVHQTRLNLSIRLIWKYAPFYPLSPLREG